MNYPIKGTLNDLAGVVPAEVISMMVSQKRRSSYIFTIDAQNGFLLVW